MNIFQFIVIVVTGCLIGGLTGCQRHTASSTKPLANHMIVSRPLPIPVKGVKRHQLTDTWGAARDRGTRHEGIDIMAAQGTPIYSTVTGEVMNLTDNPRGGHVIWIKAVDGSWHYFAHLDRHVAGLTVGEQIRVGHKIGYVGNTGNARHTAPHLHYAIYLQGKGKGAVNPYDYLR